MTAQIWILGLERVDERLERRGRDSFQAVPLPLQLGGPRGDLFLEPLIELAILEQHLAALQGAMHGAAQIGELDRLGEVVHRTALHAERGAGGVVDGGQHEDRQLRLDFDRLRNEIDAARPGHANVGQHERHFVQT